MCRLRQDATWRQASLRLPGSSDDIDSVGPMEQTSGIFPGFSYLEEGNLDWDKPRPKANNNKNCGASPLYVRHLFACNTHLTDLSSEDLLRTRWDQFVRLATSTTGTLTDLKTGLVVPNNSNNRWYGSSHWLYENPHIFNCTKFNTNLTVLNVGRLLVVLEVAIPGQIQLQKNGPSGKSARGWAAATYCTHCINTCLRLERGTIPFCLTGRPFVHRITGSAPHQIGGFQGKFSPDHTHTPSQHTLHNKTHTHIIWVLYWSSIYYNQLQYKPHGPRSLGKPPVCRETIVCLGGGEIISIQNGGWTPLVSVREVGRLQQQYYRRMTCH